MTRLTNEHRRLIETGMMRKTNFRQRFEDEIARLANGARQMHREWLVRTYGESLVALIDGMTDVHKKNLLRKVDCVGIDSYQSFRSYELAPNFFDFVDLNKNSPRDCYCDFEFYVGGSLGRKGLIDLSVPAWEPNRYVNFVIAGQEGAKDLLSPINELAGEFLKTSDELGNFLKTVTTAEKLKKLMPEAMQFLPEVSRPLAVVPEPANALAALKRAGFYEKKEAAHA